MLNGDALKVGFTAVPSINEQGVLNVYLGKAPAAVNSWDGSGQNWFKVH